MANINKAAPTTAEQEAFKAFSSEIENRIRKFIADSDQKGCATFDPNLPNGWRLDMCNYDKIIDLTVTNYGINRILWMSKMKDVKINGDIESVANVIAYAISRCSDKDDLAGFCDYGAPPYLKDKLVNFSWRRGVTIHITD